MKVIISTLEISGKYYPVEITIPNNFDPNNPRFRNVEIRFPQEAPDYYHIRREVYVAQLLSDPEIQRQIVEIVRKIIGEKRFNEKTKKVRR